MENKDELRLKTVRRFDPHVVHIVDSASRTALYTYDQETESWSNTEVQGTFMIYAREAPPHNMIIIINRLNKTNFMEPLTSSCDIQVNPPFLLFKNFKGCIYGIWFSANEIVLRISTAIREKLHENPQPPSQSSALTQSSQAVGGDIMSMLSHAHGVYERLHEPSCIVTTASSKNNDLVKPSPLRASEQNTTNVADFFAKVGMSTIGTAGANLPSPSSEADTTTHPVLQKLFQGAAAIGGQASVATTVGGSAPISIPGTTLQSHSSMSSSVPASAPISLQELEGKLKENLQISQNKDESNATNLNTVVQQGPSSLLSPHVFTSNVPERDLTKVGDPVAPSTSNYCNILTPGPSLGVQNKPLNGSQESLFNSSLPQSNITPLTHEQLVQAFSILLKKNDFVQQLHEAYIQALNQSLKGCL